MDNLQTLIDSIQTRTTRRNQLRNDLADLQNERQELDTAISAIEEEIDDIENDIADDEADLLALIKGNKD